ncbi:MAG: hypothetical protein KDI36_04860 [Pseudomonadales bacterium]|nr:hypothetical protein [Pseudomonadales bacterium]
MTSEDGRHWFLDIPCDYQPGEDVTFILNIHGAGSIANWQRHYFPALDFKEKYRLVIATPSAAGSRSMGEGRPAVRVWDPAADDAHLRGIVNTVIRRFGADHIRSFWLAGHSQGGMTSHRLVCTDFYRNKVDGLLSLSGGRIGQAELVPAFGPPMPDGSPPPARARRFPQGELPDCDFSHIYTTGEYEIVSLPDSSPWADKYQCDAPTSSTIEDTEPGWVQDTARMGYRVWGMAARPGTAASYEYQNCADGRVVADVVRLDKGHTEGLEPRVTEHLVQLMVKAPGGKLRTSLPAKDRPIGIPRIRPNE